MNLILYSVYPHNPQCICCGLICEKRDCLTSFALLVADNPQSLLGTRWSKHGNRWTMKPANSVWPGGLQKDYISVHVDHKTSMNGSGPVCRWKLSFSLDLVVLSNVCLKFTWRNAGLHVLRNWVECGQLEAAAGGGVLFRALRSVGWLAQAHGCGKEGA